MTVQDGDRPHRLWSDRPVHELVVLVGLQGSGKSTLVQERFRDSHRVVSKDHWPNARHRQARQLRVIEELLAAGHSVVVDNTNPSVDDRAPLVALGQQYGCDTVAVFVDTPLEVCRRRNASRTGRAQVPEVGLRATAQRLTAPTLAEGFDRVEMVKGDEP